MATNVIRAEEARQSDQVVELARFGGISPEQFHEGNRNRLAIKDKLAREANVLANRARQDRVNQMRLATEESTSIVAKAREEANGIVQKAISERARIEKESHQKGLESAREEARVEALATVEDALGKIEAIALELKTTKDKFLRAGSDAMVSIITAVLEKILRGRIHVSPVLILQTIDTAIHSISAGDRISVRVHPDDLGTAESYTREIISRVEGLTEVAFTADPGITRGGALIESDFGRVDARLESQLAEILREIEVSVRAVPISELAEIAEESEDSAGTADNGEVSQ